MPTPFDNLTISQVRAAAASAAAPFYRTNLAYADGDHWQGGTAWVGPMPAAHDAGSAAVCADIQKVFTAKNAIGEVITRHVDGVIGREPAWSFTPRRALKANKKPTKAEQALIDEAEQVLTTWWDKRQIHSILKQAARTLLLGDAAMLRLTVSSADGFIPQADLATSLERIYVEALQADQGTVKTDTATREQCAMATFTDGNSASVELSYLDGELTIVRVLSQNGEQVAGLPLGGRLTMQQTTRAAFLSAPVRQNQNQLNLAKTMLGRNVIQGGFLERIFLNAQAPGEYVNDPNVPVDELGQRRRFVPRPLQTGAGATNFVTGKPQFDKEGKLIGYTPASVVFRDPVAVDTFEATATGAYRSILEEVQQLHALIAGDATASAVSRVQARADFEASLRTTKAALDALVRWLLETVLALACVFSGQVGRFEALRAVCDCRLDTGPVTPEERQAIAQLYKDGLLSRESAMSLLGVEDVDAEIARIEAEQAKKQQQAQQIAQGQNQNQPATTDQQPTTTTTSNNPANAGATKE